MCLYDKHGSIQLSAYQMNIFSTFDKLSLGLVCTINAHYLYNFLFFLKTKEGQALPLGLCQVSCVQPTQQTPIHFIGSFWLPYLTNLYIMKNSNFTTNQQHK